MDCIPHFQTHQPNMVPAQKHKQLLWIRSISFASVAENRYNISCTNFSGIKNISHILQINKRDIKVIGYE